MPLNSKDARGTMETITDTVPPDLSDLKLLLFDLKNALERRSPLTPETHQNIVKGVSNDRSVNDNSSSNADDAKDAFLRFLYSVAGIDDM